MKHHGGKACKGFCDELSDDKFYCYDNDGGWGYCSPSPEFSVTGKLCTDSCYSGKCDTARGREHCTEPATGAQGRTTEELLLRNGTRREPIKIRFKRGVGGEFRYKHIRVYENPCRIGNETHRIINNPSGWMNGQLNETYRCESRRCRHTFLLLSREEDLRLEFWAANLRNDNVGDISLGDGVMDKNYCTVEFRKTDVNDPNHWEIAPDKMPEYRHVIVATREVNRQRNIHHFVRVEAPRGCPSAPCGTC